LLELRINNIISKSNSFKNSLKATNKYAKNQSLVTFTIGREVLSLWFVLALAGNETIQQSLDLAIGPVTAFLFFSKLAWVHFRLIVILLGSAWGVLEIVYSRGTGYGVVFSLLADLSVFVARVVVLSFIDQHLFVFSLGLLLSQHFEELFWVGEFAGCLGLLGLCWCLLLVDRHVAFSDGL